MKCIRDKKTGEIVRVRDMVAFSLVNDVGVAEYVSKKEWKAQCRKINGQWKRVKSR